MSNIVYRQDTPSYKSNMRADASPRPIVRAAVRARGITPGEAKVARHQLALHGHRVPAWVSDAAVVGIFEEASRRDSKGRDMLDDPKLLSHLSELPEARVDSARRDFGPGFGSQPSGEESDPASALMTTMANAWKTPSRSALKRGRSGDDSQPSNKATPAKAGIGAFDDVHFSEANENAPRVTREQTESPMRSAFNGGNQGNNSGSFGSGGMDAEEQDWMMDGAAKAEAAMRTRLSSAWQKGAR